jgi:hypothetical protein
LKDPVWISIPANGLKRAAETVPAMRLVAATVAGAERITLTLGPKEGGDFAAKLEAICGSPQTAATIAEQLKKVTAALKATGTFQQSDQKVFGYWPISKGAFENLAGGM